MKLFAEKLLSEMFRCFEIYGDVAQFVEGRTGTPAEAVSIPRCGKGFFSHSQLSVQTLLRVSARSLVQSHALTSTRTLKIL